MRNFAILLAPDGSHSRWLGGRFLLAKLDETYPAPAPRLTRLFIGYVDGTATLDALNYTIEVASLFGHTAELELFDRTLEITAEERDHVTACLKAAGYIVKESA